MKSLLRLKRNPQSKMEEGSSEKSSEKVPEKSLMHLKKGPAGGLSNLGHSNVPTSPSNENVPHGDRNNEEIEDDDFDVGSDLDSEGFSSVSEDGSDSDLENLNNLMLQDKYLRVEEEN